MGTEIIAAVLSAIFLSQRDMIGDDRGTSAGDRKSYKGTGDYERYVKINRQGPGNDLSYYTTQEFRLI